MYFIVYILLLLLFTCILLIIVDGIILLPVCSVVTLKFREGRPKKYFLTASASVLFVQNDVCVCSFDFANEQTILFRFLPAYMHS